MLNDFIREIKATAVNFKESIEFNLYTHKEPNLVAMVRRWGLRYTVREVILCMDC